MIQHLPQDLSDCCILIYIRQGRALCGPVWLYWEPSGARSQQRARAATVLGTQTLPGALRSIKWNPRGNSFAERNNLSCCLVPGSSGQCAGSHACACLLPQPKADCPSHLSSSSQDRLACKQEEQAPPVRMLDPAAEVPEDPPELGTLKTAG